MKNTNSHLFKSLFLFALSFLFSLFQANASTPQEELAQFLEEDDYLAQQILHGENLDEFQEQREILVEATINA